MPFLLNVLPPRKDSLGRHVRLCPVVGEVGGGAEVRGREEKKGDGEGEGVKVHEQGYADGDEEVHMNELLARRLKEALKGYGLADDEGADEVVRRVLAGDA